MVKSDLVQDELAISHRLFADCLCKNWCHRSCAFARVGVCSRHSTVLISNARLSRLRRGGTREGFNAHTGNGPHETHTHTTFGYLALVSSRTTHSGIVPAVLALVPFPPLGGVGVDPVENGVRAKVALRLFGLDPFVAVDFGSL